MTMAAHLGLDGARGPRPLPAVYDLTGDTDSEPELVLVSFPFPSLPFLPLSAQPRSRLSIYVLGLWLLPTTLVHIPSYPHPTLLSCLRDTVF
jgi:hypothetical protein